MLDSIIFDIDGTLANISHRLHFVNNGKKNWEAFFKGIPHDEPIPELIELVIDLMSSAQKPILFATGRPESTRTDTTSWLTKNGIDVDFSARLFMRKNGDRRSDVIVKFEMISMMKQAGYRPTLIFDDRQSVVDMWRSEGVRVAQVAPGKF